METPDPADVQRAVGARYEVLELAGAGGMGAVYRARHRELGHQVAIKVLPPEIASSRVREERFRREAQLSAHLSHPNLVPVFEFETHEGLTYLIMPFVRGRTLQALLAERQRLSLPELLRVLHDVGAALDFIHPRGVVHRDVKPANILIEDETERALLADFGVALAGVSGGSLTGVGVAIGTPAYLPPEQQTGAERVDGRADLYSLALVAFEALTGDLPNAGLDRAALATALRKQRRDVSPILATALVAPLAERPSERPETAAAWLHGIGRSTGQRRPGPVLAVAAFVLLSVAAWIAWGRFATHPGTERSIAVMPFVMLGSNRDLAPAQLPTWFQNRLPSVPELTIISAAKVASLAGEHAPAIGEAQAVAAHLGATHFVQPSLELQGSHARMSARLYVTKSGKLLRQSRDESGSADSLSEIMDAVWAQLLPPIVRSTFAPVSSVTMPHTLAALLAYANAEEAFRRGDYETARDEYNRVVAADSSFAIGYFRRALVVAQVDPREESFRAALAGAQRHQFGLEPADSLLLEGYRQLLERGDGRAALALFKKAASLAPDQPQVWFALGEFYYHFGALFDQGLQDAQLAFDSVLGLAPDFAPAVAHLISFAVSRDDREAMERLIHQYEGFGTQSVVTETVGIVDTMLLHAPPAKLRLLQTLGNHSFTALEFLAFQVQIFGTPDQRRGPSRDVLRALERRAATDSEEVRALRLEVAADLAEGWIDSARARLARTATPATAHERDMWLVLARVARLDSLGDWLGAAGRLEAGLAAGRGGEIVHWMLARLDRDRARHRAALARLAADSAPLPRSLLLDLDARTVLATGDSASALGLWQAATQRYAVLRVPFDLAASLWWLRRDLAQLARAQRDTTLTTRTCDSFASPIGYTDIVVRPVRDRFCPQASAARP